MKKRLYIGLLLSIFSVTFILGGVSHASVNDFTIKDFQADYYLSKDDNNRSVLKTVEQITAIFPDYDQNHGIERAIPKTYDGHAVNLNIQSVVDENGKNLNYSLIDSNGNTVIRIGDADLYVHGTMKYVVTYIQHDVTKYFSDTKDDEFYWDVNGNSWSQNFEKVTARVHIDSEIFPNLNKSMSCYYGSFGSNSTCAITQKDNIISAETTGLQPQQTMTIAIGFNGNTFSGYQKTSQEKLLEFLFAAYFLMIPIALVASVAILIYAIFLKFKYGKDAKSSHAIVPEYIPPRDVDVITAAVILKNNKTWVAAEYIDLAVNNKIKIIEFKKGIFNKKSYKAELISINDLSDSELKIVSSLFGSDLVTGVTYEFKSNRPDYGLYSKLKSTREYAEGRADNDGYFEDAKQLKNKMKKLIIALSIMMLFMGASIISLIFVSIILASIRPLSPKGRDLADYLDGMKMYIKTAEEDRIKYLQSPRGAEKVQINTNDDQVMVKIYEKLLPYAVLFGNEKDWAKVMGEYYDKKATSPDWYSGSGVFNAAVFSSAISSFSATSITNSYSSPASSSSGGSGGGGFSGGGGGGGGGGGW